MLSSAGSAGIQMNWLPACDALKERVKALRSLPDSELWTTITSIAKHRLDFIETNSLDAVARSHSAFSSATGEATRSVRLAILGSSTTNHLAAGIRVGGLRRQIHITTYETGYGLFRQELFDAKSGLHKFKPDFALFVFDARYITAGLQSAFTREQVDSLITEKLDEVVALWNRARSELKASVMQQTILPVFPDLMGGNEFRLWTSPAAFCDLFNQRIQLIAERLNVCLIAVDRYVRRDGTRFWYDSAVWHRSKQEIGLRATPLYGDLVARTVAAIIGCSSKCLVLDLDNTIWGGTVGDDGVDGLILGSGSAVGEAFSDVQRYAAALSARGIILAICSKNFADLADQVFQRHPEMILRRDQVACFFANWDDKATNLRRIATELNIGLDSLVFVDDSPFEREQVRRELPMVAVPEVSADPALVPQAIADGGYFEAVTVSFEDLNRTSQYKCNAERRMSPEAESDISDYLRSLQMRLQWCRVGPKDIQRTVQLINKTNQFNLTSRRYSEEGLREILARPEVIGLVFRLLDRFGDNGIIAVLIGQVSGDVLDISTWLMSCRVLGREVEKATLRAIVVAARQMGARRLAGSFIPTAKNAVVRGHYDDLKFDLIMEVEDGTRCYELNLEKYLSTAEPIELQEV